jgi:hypothetical protein
MMGGTVFSSWAVSPSIQVSDAAASTGRGGLYGTLDSRE